MAGAKLMKYFFRTEVQLAHNHCTAHFFSPYMIDSMRFTCYTKIGQLYPEHLT